MCALCPCSTKTPGLQMVLYRLLAGTKMLSSPWLKTLKEEKSQCRSPCSWLLSKAPHKVLFLHSGNETVPLNKAEKIIHHPPPDPLSWGRTVCNLRFPHAVLPDLTLQSSDGQKPQDRRRLDFGRDSHAFCRGTCSQRTGNHHYPLYSGGIGSATILLYLEDLWNPD